MISSPKKELRKYNEIKEFTKGTIAENAPIIPVSAHHDVNLDILIEAIRNHSYSDSTKHTRSIMHVARSFDINRPGTRPENYVEGNRWKH